MNSCKKEEVITGTDNDTKLLSGKNASRIGQPDYYILDNKERTPDKAVIAVEYQLNWEFLDKEHLQEDLEKPSEMEVLTENLRMEFEKKNNDFVSRIEEQERIFAQIKLIVDGKRTARCNQFRECKIHFIDMEKISENVIDNLKMVLEIKTTIAFGKFEVPPIIAHPVLGDNCAVFTETLQMFDSNTGQFPAQDYILKQLNKCAIWKEPKPRGGWGPGGWWIEVKLPMFFYDFRTEYALSPNHDIHEIIFECTNEVDVLDNNVTVADQELIYDKLKAWAGKYQMQNEKIYHHNYLNFGGDALCICDPIKYPDCPCSCDGGYRRGVYPDYSVTYAKLRAGFPD